MSKSKKVFALLCVLATAFAYQLMQPAASQAGMSAGLQQNRASQARGPIIWIEIGRPKKGCAGLGICRGGGGDPPTRKAGVNRVVSSSTTVAGEHLTFEFRSQVPEKGATFAVDEDFVFDAATSRQLGFQSVTILRGEYQVDHQKGRFGAVTVKTKVTKLDDRSAK